jgi:hypothetical protein
MTEEIIPLLENTKDDRWPNLSALAADIAANGLQASLIVMKTEPEDSAKQNRRRHDIAAALRTLSLTVEALKDGYQFDDELSDAKIRAIEKAVSALERESNVWMEILREV